jgi:hypothetical protein
MKSIICTQRKIKSEMIVKVKNFMQQFTTKNVWFLINLLTSWSLNYVIV